MLNMFVGFEQRVCGFPGCRYVGIGPGVLVDANVWRLSANEIRF